MPAAPGRGRAPSLAVEIGFDPYGQAGEGLAHLGGDCGRRGAARTVPEASDICGDAFRPHQAAQALQLLIAARREQHAEQERQVPAQIRARDAPLGRQKPEPGAPVRRLRVVPAPPVGLPLAIGDRRRHADDRSDLVGIERSPTKRRLACACIILLRLMAYMGSSAMSPASFSIPSSISRLILNYRAVVHDDLVVMGRPLIRPSP
jgi:hypothetical protein